MADWHQRVKMTLHNHTQAGVVLINLQGYLIGYGWVWFLERGISNILTLTNVKTRYRVLYDNQDENDFVVHTGKNPFASKNRSMALTRWTQWSNE